MDEKRPTYMQLKKPLTSKKHMPKNNQQEQIIHSDLKGYPLSTNETKIKIESSKEKESPVPSAWRLTVAILAGSCFFLLVTTGILGFRVFQGDLTAQPGKSPLENVTQEDKSPLQSPPFQSAQTNTGIEQCAYKAKWSCCGENCYYFSVEMKNFEDSRKICKEMSSTLLKIEDIAELNFIQSQISYFSWIGLSREGTSRPWTWEDKSTCFLNFIWEESETGNCGSLKSKTLTASACHKLKRFICKKKSVCLSTMQ